MNEDYLGSRSASQRVRCFRTTGTTGLLGTTMVGVIAITTTVAALGLLLLREPPPPQSWVPPLWAAP